MKYWVIILFFLSFSLTSCFDDDGGNCETGEGGIVEEVIDLQPFTGIELRDGFPVTILQGETQSVTVRAQKNIIDRLQRNIVSDVWLIELGSGCYANFVAPEIEIVVPDLNLIKNQASALIRTENFIDQSDLEVQVNGSGGLNLGGFNGTRNFNVIIGGSGDIDCITDFSQLQNLNIVSTGSGNYNGFEVRTDVATIAVRGSGNSNVTVRDQLNVQLIGSGSVFYKGDPELNIDASGSGEVVDSN